MLTAVCSFRILPSFVFSSFSYISCQARWTLLKTVQTEYRLGAGRDRCPSVPNPPSILVRPNQSRGQVAVEVRRWNRNTYLLLYIIFILYPFYIRAYTRITPRRLFRTGITTRWWRTGHWFDGHDDAKAFPGKCQNRFSLLFLSILHTSVRETLRGGMFRVILDTVCLPSLDDNSWTYINPY